MLEDNNDIEIEISTSESSNKEDGGNSSNKSKLSTPVTCPNTVFFVIPIFIVISFLERKDLALKIFSQKLKLCALQIPNRH